MTSGTTSKFPTKMGCDSPYSLVIRALLVISCLLPTVLCAKFTKSAKIDIDLTSVTFRTSERYLSVAIDSGVVQHHWETFDFFSTRVHTLAAALAPAYLRLGGTSADFLIFNPGNVLDLETENERVETTPRNASDEPHSNFTMSAQDWDNLNTFSGAMGWQLLFDFNVLLRRDSQWDDDNARMILKYSAEKGYSDNLLFQLGNEPNAFQHALNRSLSATQLGKDFQHLHSLLEHYNRSRQSTLVGPDITNPSGSSVVSPFTNSLLVGPDVTRPRHLKVSKHPRKGSTQYLKEFLTAVEHKIDAVTWHQYYFSGETAKVEDFLNCTIMDVFGQQTAAIQQVMKETGCANTKMWLSETSTAYGGGAPGLSDRYVAGFLWLDKLGLAALHGTEVIIRQTFYGGHYSLIDNDLQPLPDYWLSLLYKILVGSDVLKVTVEDKVREIRLYAHCTNTPRSGYPAGAVTLYGLNVGSDPVTINLPAQLQAAPKLQYLLTPYGPEGLKSSFVSLNGKKLELLDDRTLPELLPKRLGPAEAMVLPSQSMAFWVLPEAKAAACA